MPELETRGHTAIAMDLPVEDGTATFDDYALVAWPAVLADALVSTLSNKGSRRDQGTGRNTWSFSATCNVPLMIAITSVRVNVRGLTTAARLPMNCTWMRSATSKT